MADFALGTAELGVIVNLDGLQKGINEAQQKAGDGFTVMGGTIATALGNAISAAGGVVLDQVGNIFGAINAGVQSNIQFETYETQFAVLLKTTDEFKAKAQGISDPLQQQAIAAEMAKTRIGELAAFGAATPFDLPGVVEADKILQGFGLHSQESADKFGYSGTQIRTIAGDVASGTGQKFQDISLYLGKFASGATGEAISRFQELGITTREELTKMGVQFSKSGELTSPLPEAMNTILGVMQTKFGGMMAAQSATLDGMLSNFGDWKEGALRTFAAPIFDVFKNSMGAFLAFTTAHADQINSALTSIGEVIAGVLSGAFDFLTNSVIPGFIAGWQMLAPAVETAMTVLQTVGEIFTGLANEALGWGENIINQLAGGMMGAASGVIDILNQIGAIITDLLIPHSPPKLLPGLTVWGMGAINAYMAGWGQGDFTVFNGIGSAIENSLKQINAAAGSKNTNIATVMLGSQDAIANAINEIKNVGSVSEETFQKIITAAGPAGPQVTGLVRAYLELERTTQEVSRAQEELNSVTEEYSAKLAPLQGALKEIQDKKQAIQDQERLKDLQEKMVDQSLTDSERQIAALEIQEIQTKQQIKTTEQERDVAVGAAKAKLDAAKEQQAAAKAQVDQQNQLLAVNKKQNDLIAEQTKAMESAGKAMGGAAGAMKGAADGMKPLTQAAQNLNDAVHAGKDSIEGFKSNLSSIGNIANAVGTGMRGAGIGFSAFGQAIQSMVNSALPVFNNLVNVVTLTIRSIITAIQQNSSVITATLTSTWNTLLSATSTVFNAVMGVVNAVLGVLVNLMQTHGTSMFTTVITVWANIQNTVNTVINMVAAVVNAVFGQIATFINTNQSSISATIATVWNTVGSIISTVAQIISSVVVTVFGAILSFIQAHGTQIQAILTTAWNLIASIVTTALNLIQGVVTVVLNVLQGNWAGAWAAIQAMSAQFVLGIYNVIVNALNLIANFFGTSLSGIAATWQGAWQGIQAAASSVWDSVKATAQSFVDGLIGIIQGSVDGLKSAAQSGLDGILEIWNGFTDWAGIGSDVIDGIIDGIKSGIGALESAVKGAAQSALNAAKALLGIASPSKVFADEVGAPTAEGILVGFLRELPNVDKNIVDALAETLDKIVQSVTNSIAAISQLQAFDTPGLRNLNALLGDIKQLAISFAQAGADLEKDTLKNAKSFADGIKDILDIIKSAVDGIGGIADMLVPTRQQIDIFALKILRIVTDISEVASLIDIKLVEAGAEFAKSAKEIIGIVSGAVDAFSKLATIASVPKESISVFNDNLRQFVDSFLESTRGLSTNGVTAAALLAEQINKIIGIISSAVDAFAKLSTVSIVPRRAIVNFQMDMDSLLIHLNTLARQWPVTALELMATFSNGVQLILGFIGSAVEAFNQLSEFKAIPDRAFSDFYIAMWDLLRYLHTLAQNWPKEAIALMSAFGDGVTKALSFIGAAIDNINRLQDLAPIPDRALSNFYIAMWQTLGYLHTLAQNWPKEAIDTMAVFGSGVDKALSIIGTAIDQFTKLRDFIAIPQENVTAFGASLIIVIRELAVAAETIGSNAAGAAKILADGIGNSLSIIGTGVDGFVKLQTLQTVSIESVAAFKDGLIQTVTALAEAATGFTKESLDAAALFADGASKVLGVISGAVDAFAKLKDVSRLNIDSVYAFSFNVVIIVNQFQKLARGFVAGSIDAAIVFADGVGKILSIIGGAVEAFDKLKDVSRIGIDHIYAFSFNVVIILNQLRQMAEVFTVESVNAATVFATAISGVISAITSGLDGFDKLKDVSRIGIDHIYAFSFNVVIILNQLRQMAEVFTIEAVTQASIFAENATKVVNMVAGAIDAFKKINSTKEIGSAAFNEFVKNITELMNKISATTIDASINLGASLMQGIIKGIQSQSDALVKALDDAMGKALEGVKKTLGIASPSKVFEEQVGTNIAAGIASGMNKITEPNFGGLLAATDNFRSASVAMAANTPLTSNNASYTEQYNVYASYKHQEESTIRDDLRMVHMLRGR